MSKQLALKIENLSKVYNLGEIGTGTISRDLERWIAKKRGKEDPFLRIGESNDRTQKGESSIVYSLKNINLEIPQGEAVGIIGKNGAGKSSLLKIISRVTSPTSGKIYINGRVASLLEVGTGFNQELTGRENIYINGAILGMKKKEISRKFDEIVNFAGVERYIDTPVKRYSSGMFVRLAFAVAAHLECEIMIVDEVLAVGDAEFQKKCLGKMGGVMENEGRTILFVSHDMNAISKLCSSAILMDKGQVIKTDDVNTIINDYMSLNTSAKSQYKSSGAPKKSVYIDSITVLNKDKKPANIFYINESVFIQFEIGIKDPEFKCDLFLTILDAKKRRVFSCESNELGSKMTLEIKPWQLTRGNFSIETFLNIPQVTKVEHIEDTCDFTIIDNASPMMKHGGYDYGVVLGNYQWDIS